MRVRSHIFAVKTCGLSTIGAKLAVTWNAEYENVFFSLNRADGGCEMGWNCVFEVGVGIPPPPAVQILIVVLLKAILYRKKNLQLKVRESYLSMQNCVCLCVQS